MSDSSSDRNPLEALAEQFVQRQRNGERLTLEAFAREHPDLAEDIRDLFPVLIKIENVRPGSGDATGPAHNGAPALERIGDYRILREVGRGGMGVVYEAEQVSLGRHVALKVLPSSALLDARQVDRFSREAKAAARLHHTNIVPVYGVGEQEGLYYYVMQFIQGLGLDQVLAELRALRKGEPLSPIKGELSAVSVAQSLLSGDLSSSVRLPGQPDGSSLSGTGREYWQSVARIGAQVARALAHAHHQGTLHRDIKPSNLLLDARGNVWVTDFGLAKAADSGDLTSTGEVVGTLRYIPPERFEGHSDSRGDIYSLGLTLYELLTLRPAYESDERHRLLERILRDDPPAPRKLDPSIPRDLETVVLKAMSRDPARRYAKADELADDLDCFAEDRPIQARRMGSVERFARWCRRNPVVASLSAAVALLLVSVAVVASVGAHLAGRQARIAEAAAESEEEQRKAAEASAAENQAMLGKQLVAQGERLMEQGDLAGALVYFTEALRRDADPAREREHRVRVGNTLRQTPRPTAVLDHGSPVRTMAQSPDGRLLATVGDDGKVRVWNLANGSAAGGPLDHGQAVSYLAFTPDGKRLISGGALPARKEPGGYELRVWDLATRRPAFLPNLRGRLSKEPSFDEALTRVALIVGERKAQVFDLATGKPAGPALDVGQSLEYAELSLDGSRVVLRTQRPIENEEAGRVMVTELKLLDPRTGKEIRWEGGLFWDSTSWFSFRFLPGGRLISLTREFTTYRDAATGKNLWTQVRDLNSIIPYSPVASPDGRRLLFTPQEGSSLSMQRGFNQPVLDLATGRQIGGFVTGPGLRSSFSPDGRSATRLAEDNSVEVVDVSTGLPRGRAMRHAARVQLARFSPDGRLLLTQAGSELRVWYATAGTPVTPILGHEQPVQPPEFTADGSHVVAVSGGHVRLWPVRATPPGDLVLGRTLAVGPAQLSDDGRRVLTIRPDPGSRSRGAVFQVWDAVTGRAIARRPVENVPGWSPVPVTLGPDGRRVLFTATRRGGTVDADNPFLVWIWDVDHDRLLPLPTQSVRVSQAEFSPDGREIVTVFHRGTRAEMREWNRDAWTEAQVWDATTGRPVGPATRMPSDSFRSYLNYLWAGRPMALALASSTGQQQQPLRRVDLRTGRELPPLKARPLATALIRSRLPAASADGRRLLLSTSDSPTGTTATALALLDQETGELLRRWELGRGRLGIQPGSVTSPGWQITPQLNADGSRAAAVVTEEGTTRARLWDADTGEAIASPLAAEQGVVSLWFSPDGRALATVNEGGVARVWSSGDGRPVTPPIEVGRGEVFVWFSKDAAVLFTHRRNRRQVSGSEREFGETRLWSAASGQPLTPPMRLVAINSVSNEEFGGRFNSAGRRAHAGDSTVADRLVLSEHGSTSVRDLSPTRLAAGELRSLAAVLGGRRIDDGNLERRTEPQFLAGWREVSPLLAGELANQPLRGPAWHQAQFDSLSWSLDKEVRRPTTADPEGATFAARWHLDRLIAADAANGQLYVHRAEANQKLGEDAAALADLTKAFEHKLTPYYLRGGILARQGRLKEAEADLARAFDPKSNDDLQAAYALGMVRLKLGDRAGYAAVCEAVAKSATEGAFRFTTQPLFETAPEGARWVPEVDNFQRRFGGSNPINFNMAAARQYRREEYRGARDLLGRLRPGEPGDARNWFFRAMAEKKLGDDRAAKVSLAEGIRVLDASRSKPRDDGDTAFDAAGGWLDRVSEDLLRKEAEELLKGK